MFHKYIFIYFNLLLVFFQCVAELVVSRKLLDARRIEIEQLQEKNKYVPYILQWTCYVLPVENECLFFVWLVSTRYWSQSGREEVDQEATSCGWSCPPTLTSSIEMTSYALLTYAIRGDVSEGIPVMKWLLGQQNEFGGFRSTQVIYTETWEKF